MWIKASRKNLKLQSPEGSFVIRIIRVRKNSSSLWFNQQTPRAQIRVNSWYP